MVEELTYQQIMQMFAETDRRMREGFDELKEGDKRLQKGHERVQHNIDKMSKEITRLRNLFESQWSRLIEALVDGKLVELLKERGIHVNRTTTNYEGNHRSRQYEFDILAVNGSEVVVVEVKSRLQVQDIKELLEELKQFKTWVPEYQDKKIYGAVAYLRVDENAIKYAENQGLFVIKAVGDSASMINSSDFQPRSW